MENSSNAEQVKDIPPILRLAVTLIFSMTKVTPKMRLPFHKDEASKAFYPSHNSNNSWDPKPPLQLCQLTNALPSSTYTK